MISLSVPELNGNELKYLKECLDSGWVSTAGPYVDDFEKKFNQYIGAKSSIATVNGTAALHLALKSLGIGEGDEVIVPSFTFIATANAIKYSGAEPVFVDVCKDTFVIDADKIEELITEKTKCILPVHLYGQPADMDKIMEIAKKHRLYVVEDASESLGSKYKGRYTGTIGHAGCFSFNGNKLITTGNGGMLVTQETSTGGYARYLTSLAKEIGEDGTVYYGEVGYNYKMSCINAAMGLAQLESINKRIEVKMRISAQYQKLLKGIQGIKLSMQREECETVFWLNSIIVEKEFEESRDDLIIRLQREGIETRPFFYPIHMMKPYRSCRHGDLSISEYLMRHGLSLPSSIGLTDKEIEKVCENFIKSCPK